MAIKGISTYTEILHFAGEVEQDRDRWRVAAEELMGFIKTHVRIVGQEEIDGYYSAKEYYDIAKNHD